jgi:hypothetical protein
MTRQYLTAKFRPADKRAYTYHNDGPPVAPGNEVKLPSTRGTDGWLRGTVFGLISEAEAKAQPFDTKAILGLVNEPMPTVQPDLLTAKPAEPTAPEWRPFQSGDAIPTKGMFEVHYRAELDPPRAPEVMPADKINWQLVSRFRFAPEAPAGQLDLSGDQHALNPSDAKALDAFIREELAADRERLS